MLDDFLHELPFTFPNTLQVLGVFDVEKDLLRHTVIRKAQVVHQIGVFLTKVCFEIYLHLDVKIPLRLFRNLERGFRSASDLILPAVCDALDVFPDTFLAIINRELHSPSVGPSRLLFRPTEDHTPSIPIGELAKPSLYVPSLFDELRLRLLIHQP